MLQTPSPEGSREAQNLLQVSPKSIGALEQRLAPGDPGYFEVSEEARRRIEEIERNSREAALAVSQTIFD
jgi:hypothetical protein